MRKKQTDSKHIGQEAERREGLETASTLMSGSKHKPRFREARLAIAWGVPWGTAVGFWALAPHFIHSHHIYEPTPLQWLILEIALLFSFIALIVPCALFAAFPLVLWTALRGRNFFQPGWAYGLAIGPLLLVSYLALAGFIVWAKFSVLPSASSYEPFFETLGGVYVVFSTALFLFYQRLVSGRSNLDTIWLVILLVATALFGAATLPYRSATLPPSVDEKERHQPVSFTKPPDKTPLLFVGLDGGNWRTLRSLLDCGALPTFAELTSNGMRGTVAGLWPPYWSGPAWAAILTGHSREKTGVYEDLIVTAPGLPTLQPPLAPDLSLVPLITIESLLVRFGAITLTPPTRSTLRQPPFWELISPAGIKTAVVRFGFTYPANGQADVIVTDWVGKDAWGLAGVQLETTSGLISPTHQASKLIGLFETPDRDDPSTFFSSPNSPDRTTDARNAVQVLRESSDIDKKTFAASRLILRSHPDLQVLAVYLGGFDMVSHAFWQYSFPGDYPDHPSRPAEIKQFGMVIDRYLEFIDRELGGLIAEFPVRPNVVIVSDHGHEATHSHPMWRGWHSPYGIFIASGPDISLSSEELTVSYYDVMPTILEILGFASPKGINGASLLKGRIYARSSE